jgi:hypothetical protein
VRFGLPFERNGYMISPHTSTSFDPMHWTNPQQFDPSRYLGVPTSAQVDEARSKQIGFAKCPFDLTTMKVSDGRNAAMAHSAFGTVFGVVDGKPLPVCDYAGFAPFGFGYRRCPGEQLTIQVFEDFLRKVWRDGRPHLSTEPWFISYGLLGLTQNGLVPVLMPLAAPHGGAAGLTYAAFSLLGVFAPFLGSWADRTGRHRDLLVWGTMSSGALLLPFEFVAEPLRIILAAGAGLGAMATATAGNGLAIQGQPEPL